MSRCHHNDERYSAVQEARLQLFLDFAEDRYLNRLSENLGVDRPFGISDDLFRALVKKTALTRHSTLKVFVDVLELLIGPKKTKVFELTEDVVVGQQVITVASTEGLPQVGVLRIDPETVNEETVNYCYVDYLTNEVWLTEPLTIAHKSRYPRSTVTSDSDGDIRTGDTTFKVADPDVFPQGNFLGVMDPGGPNEELIFVLSRSGNVLTREGEFTRVIDTRVQPTGEIAHIAHDSGETFELKSPIAAAGKLAAEIASGDLTFTVEAADGVSPMSHIFPTQEFYVTLSPGTAWEETVYVQSNDRAEPTSTFTVLGASDVLTVYTGSSLTLSGSEVPFLAHLNSAATESDSAIEVVLDRGTSEEERLFIEHDSGSVFTILSTPTATHTNSSTIELVPVISNNHAEGAAILLTDSSVSSLVAPAAVGDDKLYLTRLDRYFDSEVNDEYPVIINQGESNEDIVPIATGLVSGTKLTDKETDIMGIADTSKMLYAHEVGEPVRPATIVMDGTGWVIREGHHLVDILIPEQALPALRLQDATYFHHNGPVPSLQVDTGYSEGSEFIPFVSNETNIETLWKFPPVGLLKITDSDAPSSRDEHVKYVDRGISESVLYAGSVGVVGTGSAGEQLYLRMAGFDFSQLPAIPFSTGKFQVEVGGAAEVYDVIAVNTVEGLNNVVLSLDPNQSPSPPDISGYVNFGEVRLRAIKVANVSLFSKDDGVKFVADGISSSHTVEDTHSSGWVYLDSAPLESDIGGLLSHDPPRIRVRTESRFDNDPGLFERTASNPAMVSLAVPSHVSATTSDGSAITQSALTASVLRNDTAFTADNNFASMLEFGDALISDTTDGGTSTVLQVSTANYIPSMLVGMVLRVTDGSAAGEVRPIIANTATDITVGSAFSVAPSANTFEVYKELPSDPFNIIINEGSTSEEVLTVGSVAFNGSGPEFDVTLDGCEFAYDQALTTTVDRAGAELGTGLTSPAPGGATGDINLTYEGSHIFDDRNYEAAQQASTTLSVAVSGPSDLLVAAAPGASSLVIRDGSLLPASPTRFTVIVSPGTLEEESFEVIKDGSVPVAIFPDSATLQIQNGDVLSFAHAQFDSVQFQYEEITVADSSGFADSDGRAVLNFGHTTQEVVRYSVNDTGTGVLTLLSPTVFQYGHPVGEAADYANRLSVPNDIGTDYPAYLPPDPFERLRTWLELVKAAGIKLEFTKQV